MAPITIRTNPLKELTIKSLGYLIRPQKSFYYTIYQFTIQIKIVIGSFSVMGTNHDFIRLMTKIIDIVNCKAGAMSLPAKTNPLIGYEEKAGVLGIKMVLTLLVPPDSQADRCNGQNHILSLSKDKVAGLLKKVGVNIRDGVEDLRI
jgi:hypothetical protein